MTLSYNYRLICRHSFLGSVLLSESLINSQNLICLAANSCCFFLACPIQTNRSESSFVLRYCRSNALESGAWPWNQSAWNQVSQFKLTSVTCISGTWAWLILRSAQIAWYRNILADRRPVCQNMPPMANYTFLAFEAISAEVVFIEALLEDNKSRASGRIQAG